MVRCSLVSTQCNRRFSVPMELVGISPTTVQIKDPSPKELDEIRTSFTYRDKKVQYELFKHRKANYFRAKNPVAWEARLQELIAKEKVCLLDETAGFKTY